MSGTRLSCPQERLPSGALSPETLPSCHWGLGSFPPLSEPSTKPLSLEASFPAGVRELSLPRVSLGADERLRFNRRGPKAKGKGLGGVLTGEGCGGLREP